ncbi:MAG TPA: beta-propeller fold lactonase family protein, partial [Daejeonella sp.]|nr:beta-propeller fold lactonase family protein [Daejeonella sp.]
GRLYASYNVPSEVACLNSQTNRTLFKSPTSANPRTIALSDNQRFLFAACYEGNSIDVFKINQGNFRKVYSIPCEGKPVGIDLREDLDKLEAWVCTYKGNTLQVFTFEKR